MRGNATLEFHAGAVTDYLLHFGCDLKRKPWPLSGDCGDPSPSGRGRIGSICLWVTTTHRGLPWGEVTWGLPFLSVTAVLLWLPWGGSGVECRLKDGVSTWTRIHRIGRGERLFVLPRGLLSPDPTFPSVSRHHLHLIFHPLNHLSSPSSSRPRAGAGTTNVNPAPTNQLKQLFFQSFTGQHLFLTLFQVNLLFLLYYLWLFLFNSFSSIIFMLTLFLLIGDSCNVI